ncbi:unnamed protein product [Arctogadus glacialis]
MKNKTDRQNTEAPIDRETDKQDEREKDRLLDRLIDAGWPTVNRQTGRQTDRQTDRQTVRETDRQTDRGILHYLRSQKCEVLVEQLSDVFLTTFRDGNRLCECV